MHAFHTPWPVQGGESSESSGRQQQRRLNAAVSLLLFHPMTPTLFSH
jgi:hypothetical protein